MSGIGEKANRASQAASKPKTTCPCGRIIRSNIAAKSHLRACAVNLQTNGWPLDAGMTQALLDEYRGDMYPVIVQAVERRLGEIYLARRAQGNKTELPWRDYRDTVWAVAEQTAKEL